LRRDARVHAALIVVQFGFGAFPVAAKLILDTVSPLALAAVRVLFATPLLFLRAYHLEGITPQRRDLPLLALLGLLGVASNQILFIVGLNWTTASDAALLMPTIPVFAVAIGAATGLERVSAARVTGIALSVAGALVVLDPTRFSFGDRGVLGDGLLLANCLCYAAYLVLLRPMLRRLPPLTVTAWVFLFGGAAVVLVGGPALASTSFGDLGGRGWAALAFIVLWPTLLNYALNTWAVRRSSPSLAASYVTSQPVIAALLAVPLLGESIGLRALVGFAAISGGLLMAAGPRRAA
jgi:drug/metabolite transporter (DMT)-like permease